MENNTIIARPMRVEDAAVAMNLSAAEGWNQTANDWRFLIIHPGNICVAAVCEKEIIATTTVMDYSGRLAWIGMVLVKKTFRRRGISKLLLDHVLEKLESFPSVKLDATDQGQQVYKKFGFRKEYRIARMVNTASKNIALPPAVSAVRPAGLDHMQEIIALDEVVSGVNRAPLLEMLVKARPDKAWVLLTDNHITGFVLGRDGSKYHHIGPLVAQTQSHAAMLIMYALSKLAGPVVVDVLCDKKEMMQALTATGFSTQRYFTRMYKEKNPFPGKSGKLYTICGPEFG